MADAQKEVDEALSALQSVAGRWTDKLLHAVIGAASAIFVTALVIAVKDGLIALWVMGVLVGAAVGVAIECYQLVRKEGAFSWLDAVATAAGGVVVAFVILYSF
jgi:hypothetical protein